jgi:hypothetical protein
MIDLYCPDRIQGMGKRSLPEREILLFDIPFPWRAFSFTYGIDFFDKIPFQQEKSARSVQVRVRNAVFKRLPRMWEILNHLEHRREPG